jgi:hypothetical protein
MSLIGCFHHNSKATFIGFYFWIRPAVACSYSKCDMLYRVHHVAADDLQKQSCLHKLVIDCSLILSHAVVQPFLESD